MTKSAFTRLCMPCLFRMNQFQTSIHITARADNYQVHLKLPPRVGSTKFSARRTLGKASLKRAVNPGACIEELRLAGRHSRRFSGAASQDPASK